MNEIGSSGLALTHALMTSSTFFDRSCLSIYSCTLMAWCRAETRERGLRARLRVAAVCTRIKFGPRLIRVPSTSMKLRKPTKSDGGTTAEESEFTSSRALQSWGNALAELLDC